MSTIPCDLTQSSLYTCRLSFWVSLLSFFKPQIHKFCYICIAYHHFVEGFLDFTSERRTCVLIRDHQLLLTRRCAELWNCVAPGLTSQVLVTSQHTNRLFLTSIIHRQCSIPGNLSIWGVLLPLRRPSIASDGCSLTAVHCFKSCVNTTEEKHGFIWSILSIIIYSCNLNVILCLMFIKIKNMYRSHVIGILIM